MKILRVLGLAVGIIVIFILVRRTGWPAIEQTLALLGWGYPIVLAYPLSWMLLNSAGWRCTLPPAAPVPFVRLVQIRLTGESFNSLLPSGYVGGEPVKAVLLSKRMPLSQAVSSVLIAKSAQSVALVVFVTLGLSAGSGPGPTPLLQPPTLVAVVILSLGIGIFTWLLASQSFSRLGRWLHRVTRIAWLQAQELKLISLDESLGSFYRGGKGRFAASAAWHLGGWLAGALEVAIIFTLLGHPVSLRQAWFIGAMAQLGSVVGLISPAGIGFYEGGHYLAAQLLGLPPVMGLSVSLIRRIREIFWDSIGLALFARKVPEPKG
ncbi:MAG TPA: flippase-like domain-containing protein [Elusimicrobiota bacterium]|nr:flippase-like domain-containing protein [Elusimicrobiota bacterium]